jgi:hypothetical protein
MASVTPAVIASSAALSFNWSALMLISFAGPFFRTPLPARWQGRLGFTAQLLQVACRAEPPL